MRRLLTAVALIVIVLCAVLAVAEAARAWEPEIDGHRGREYAAAITNENTKAAFQYDAKHGVDCETDTPRIADAEGHPSQGPSVIFHDVKPATIKRVVSPESLAKAGLTGDETIDEVTPQQFAVLTARGGSPLLTLKQGIRIIGNLGISCRVDLKYKPEDPAQVARWAAKWDADLSFYQLPQDPHGAWPCALNGMTAMHDAGFIVGVKVRSDCPMTFDTMRRSGASYIAVHAQEITPGYVVEANKAGLQVGPMLAGRSCWAALIRAKVDFMIVSNPASFKRWLR